MRGSRLVFQLIAFGFGVAVLSCAFALPAISAALFFSPRAALGIALFLSVVPLSLLLLLSEWAVLRLFGGQPPRTHGLRNSYEMARDASGVSLKARPALLVFTDPVPNIFVVRALGGDGMILLSDGLIALLNEGELRFVLTRAIQHLVGGEAVLQSACIFGLALLRRREPIAGGGAFRELTPRLALRALLLYPWLRFFSRMARKSVTHRVGAAAGFDFTQGASKLARAGRLYGQQSLLPGLVYLGIEG